MRVCMGGGGGGSIGKVARGEGGGGGTQLVFQEVTLQPTIFPPRKSAYFIERLGNCSRLERPARRSLLSPPAAREEEFALREATHTWVRLRRSSKTHFREHMCGGGGGGA